jgi:hypothetical protein
MIRLSLGVFSGLSVQSAVKNILKCLDCIRHDTMILCRIAGHRLLVIVASLHE